MADGGAGGVERSDCGEYGAGVKESPVALALTGLTVRCELLDISKGGGDVLHAAHPAGDIRRRFPFTFCHQPSRNTSPFSVVTFTFEDFTWSVPSSWERTLVVIRIR